MVGVSPDQAWWAIKYPPGPNGQGWVAAQYVTAFNTENVPVIQPPPVPTPTTAPPVAVSGWRGEYFDNRDLQGQPVLVFAGDFPFLRHAFAVLPRGKPGARLAIGRQNRLQLEQHIVDGLPDFDPSKPDPVAAFNVPPSAIMEKEKPLPILVRIAEEPD